MVHPLMSELDAPIDAAARLFVSDVFGEPRWRGREHEAVSHFADFLRGQCQERTPLYDPGQIVIQGCVPGVRGLNPKGRVNKDLVLWPKPRMSCWNAEWSPSNIPMAVLEWKVFRLPTSRPTMSTHDLEWLSAFSCKHPEFVGYAISLDLNARQWRLRIDRVRSGSSDAAWLRL